jgi:SAM-dependent methyltransferase
MTSTSDSPTPAASPATLWEQQVTGERWNFYAERFEKMIADGTDLEGEARFVDAMVQREAAVLDAGCGTGRIAAALCRMGHRGVGVDKDAGLVDIASKRYPGVPFLTCDLLELTAEKLRGVGVPDSFDVIILAGNVMVYLAPGTERAVLDNLARLLRPAGRIVAGFATDRAYSLSCFCADAEANGLAVEHRCETWHLDRATDDADWAVVVLRGPGLRDGHSPQNSWGRPTEWPDTAE